MEEAYQILPASGKGWGMFASTFIKRGILILKEEPQIPVVYQPFLPNSFERNREPIFYPKKAMWLMKHRCLSSFVWKNAIFSYLVEK